MFRIFLGEYVFFHDRSGPDAPLTVLAAELWKSDAPAFKFGDKHLRLLIRDDHVRVAMVRI